jgi:hypothetical protein
MEAALTEIQAASGLDVNLSLDAFALQPVRMDEERNTFLYYEATTFPKNPYTGCEMYLRRCMAFGYLKDDGHGLTIDVLNEDGDIIQDYPITRDGFEYLRRNFKFKREPSSDAKASGE